MTMTPDLLLERPLFGRASGAATKDQPSLLQLSFAEAVARGRAIALGGRPCWLYELEGGALSRYIGEQFDAFGAADHPGVEMRLVPPDGAGLQDLLHAADVVCTSLPRVGHDTLGYVRAVAL